MTLPVGHYGTSVVKLNESIELLGILIYTYVSLMSKFAYENLPIALSSEDNALPT